MRARLWAAAVVAVGFLSATATSTAALIDQGDGTVLDTSTNLLWLKDSNYPFTDLATPGRIDSIIASVGSIDGHVLTAADFEPSNFGRMTWWGAVAWAQDLNFAGSSNWRLPSVADVGALGCNFSYSGTDCGYNVDLSTGELARLWYGSLGNTSLYDTAGADTGCGAGPVFCWTNSAPFTNALPNSYWTGTSFAPDGDHAWAFDPKDGIQTVYFKTNPNQAWAIREADTPRAAPEPATLALLGLGLAGLAASRRRKQ